MTSFVPIIDRGVTPNATSNFRNGGYFKNVIWRECTVGKYGEPQLDFWKDNNTCVVMLGYNEDCCAVMLNSGSLLQEKIDIFYDRA